ncbi:Bcr/CflA family efflux MFS transporter [Agromyces aerolatus]|uniref:Bcr/CflA family efflux MFS transporter n=1 Tax=Agromyces sp. LY-1074 TaxID=3074080 RepID=UPI002859EAC1|nr:MULTISPECIES: Bcr/CflA family efflux MFS transporter [unclassified Agromyces]MDR5699132.1 Bcr/CflA family efflux MFS transporter [Agromyces sp. LY-1074]MDR5705089.1 Bcr/CflA family efflux MFS transporter [Agromyces sp. LY-1358]
MPSGEPDGIPDIGRTRLLLLAVLTALGGLATGLYLPAFPEIAVEYDTDAAGVHLTYWLYLIGFGAGQILFGPLSDRFGRRRPLILASTLCLVASVLVALAPSLAIMAIARVLQAIGAAGGVVIARAIVSDTATGFALARKINLMVSLSMFAPVISPLLGSVVVSFLPWHVTLWMIVPVAALVVVGVVAIIPETHGHARRTSRVELRDLGVVFRSRRYTAFLLVSAAATCALLSYTGAAPFLYQTVLGFSALEFGIFYAINSLGMVALTYLSAVLAQRGVHPAKTLGVGVGVLVIAAMPAAVLPLVALPVVLFVASANHGLITGNAAALALAEVRQIAGSGSASLGGAQFIAGGIGASVVGLDGAGSATPYFVVLATCAAIALTAYLYGRSQRGSAGLS